MPLDTDALDRIKAAVTETLADELPLHGLEREENMRIAQFALDAIDRAAAESEEPLRFAVGTRVAAVHDPLAVGTVARRVEADGELHTLAVLFDGWTGETLISPRAVKPVEVTP